MNDIEKIADNINQSVLDDVTSLNALKILKHELHKQDCILINFRIGFDPNGFDIKALSIRCKDQTKIMAALDAVEQLPGQVDIKSSFGKMPNTCTISAILTSLQERAKKELGLDVRGASYDNDYVVLSFYPAVKEPEPEPLPLPPMPAAPELGEPEAMPEAPAEEPPEAPAEEPAAPATAPAPEGAPAGEAEPELDIGDIDWGAMGV